MEKGLLIILNYWEQKTTKWRKHTNLIQIGKCCQSPPKFLVLAANWTLTSLDQESGPKRGLTPGSFRLEPTGHWANICRHRWAPQESNHLIWNPSIFIHQWAHSYIQNMFPSSDPLSPTLPTSKGHLLKIQTAHSGCSSLVCDVSKFYANTNWAHCQVVHKINVCDWIINNPWTHVKFGPSFQLVGFRPGRLGPTLKHGNDFKTGLELGM